VDELASHIFDAVPDGIFVVDRARRIAWVNARLEELLEKSRGELLGLACTTFLCTQLGEGACEACFERLDSGRPVESRTIVLKDGRGRLRHFILSAKPYREKNGRVTAVIKYLREVTELTAVRTALEEQLLKSRAVLGKTVHSLALAIESRDPYTSGHQQKVSRLSRCIAQKLRPEDRQWVEGVRVAAQLHDTGKIRVPAEILSTPRRLLAEELDIIKLHPEIGQRILSSIDFTFSFSIVETILQHHERLDGSGYPRGLSGEEITPEARIIAVADVVEAMANHRPYRPAVGIQSALREIETHAGVRYDPRAVEVCLDLITGGSFVFQEPGSLMR
jgi:PAS domain S-box-containing protein